MSKIQHKHVIIRAETKFAPHQHIEIEKHLNFTIERLIKDIGMKVVLPARSIWVGTDGNEGYTGNAGLETSHFAYHIWNSPEKGIVMHPEAKALFQVDLYTCGCLGEAEIEKIIKWIDKWSIVAIETVLLDRANGIQDVHDYFS